MPTRSTTINIYSLYHPSPNELLSTVTPWLSPKEERRANIWLPHAIKYAWAERSKLVSSSAPSKAPLPDNFWLTVWTQKLSPTGEHVSSLDMVMACTQHHLGTYPIFLHAFGSDEEITSQFMVPRVEQLVASLTSLVPRDRVFSVFGHQALTQQFAITWSHRTGSVPEPIPFYAAKLTYCTKETLTPPRSELPIGHYLGLAEPSDARDVAYLCQWFAEESVYFPLDYAHALREAEELIKQRQLWVYYIAVPGKKPILASIVACTRNTSNIATVSKVFTDPSCRGKGCAERLVRTVCEFWLFEASKDAVMLYVAHDNPAASTVYHRVGFSGLHPSGSSAEGVEDWIEIGFQDAERGHW